LIAISQNCFWKPLWPIATAVAYP